ncbi:snRNA-activating protein complex subunit 4-like [Brevipalpus obovatus]|uniref:snRNA-activating protein complex subunit 4-like n=1 Tax=Brevipalpus obovatus TaxID=246614 RepID=UPI003D9ECB89
MIDFEDVDLSFLEEQPNQVAEYVGADDENDDGESGEQGHFYYSEDLPISVPSCWLLNRAYQHSLLDFRDSLQQRLRDNQALQNQLKQSIEDDDHQSSSGNEGRFYPNSMLKFMAPFFKDTKGLTPDDNDDVKLRKSRGDINICYMKLRKPWKDKDKQTLIKAVQESCLRKLTEPIVREEDALVNQIERCKAEPENLDRLSSLEDQLKAVRDELERINIEDPESILLEREKSHEIDWLSVTSRLPPVYSEFLCEIKWKNELHPSINTGFWTYQEDQELKRLVEQHPNDWDTIAKELNTNRTAWLCCQRYQSHLNESMKTTGPFSREELELVTKVIESCRIGDYIPWSQVAYFIEGRSIGQIKLCWEKLNLAKRGSRWTPLEDRQLQYAVEKYGIHDWVKISHFLPGRSNRQCRERYIMRLGIKDRKIAGWTPREDEELVRIAPMLKFKWVEIINHILRRNARQIAARYDLLERYKIEKILQSSKDFESLVPRRKPSQVINKNGTCALSEQERYDLDENLRKNRLQLETEVLSRRPKRRRFGPSAGGRKKKPLSEAKVDEKICKMLAIFDIFKGKQQQKYKAQTTEDALLTENVEKAMESLMNQRQPEQTHLLSQVVNSSLTEKALGLDSSRLKFSSPILPPNLTTANSFQRLLLMRESIKKGLPEDNSSEDLVYFGSEHQNLMKTMTSLFFWPALLSKTKAPPMPLKSVSKPLTKGRKRKTPSSAPLMAYVNTTRQRQKALFATAKSSDNTEGDETRELEEESSG